MIAKTIDEAIIDAEELEHQQYLKVYRMSLLRYLGKRKMELLKKEVELLIGIKLKTATWQLIHKSWLRKKQVLGNNQGYAIIITVENLFKAIYLYVKGKSGIRTGGKKS